MILPDWVESNLALHIGRWLLTPSSNFSIQVAPPAPDYADERYWSMLPNRRFTRRVRVYSLYLLELIGRLGCRR